MKLPVSYSLGNREASLDKDPLMRNALAEPDEQEKVIRARKRPAIDSAFTTTAGQGQGLFTWSVAGFGAEPTETLVSINDDSLNTNPDPITKLLRFTVQPPTNIKLNTAISPSVQVSAMTQYGAVATSFTGNVTVALATNPTGATLGGTVTVAAVSGVATFSTLTLNRSGEGFVLSATASQIRRALSNVFNLPTQLVFTVQPSHAEINMTMDPVEVTAQDVDGNTDTSFTGNVTVAIYSSTGSGVLSGTTTVAAVAGIASFTNLEISAEGTYTLIASCND